MIGERAPFDTGHDNAVLARKLFPNQGLHNAAGAIAFCHPRGLQYLEQAPVLALGHAAIRRSRGRRQANDLRDQQRQRELVQAKMRPLCEAGAPLKDVMAAFGFAFPLRRLKASALGPSDATSAWALSALDPAMLGRIVPEGAAAQRRWLGACFAWRNRLWRRERSPDTHFAWLAEAAARAGVGAAEAGDMADFAGWPENGFSPAWGWKRAMEEQARWHAGLTVRRMLAGTPFAADTVIDIGPHPDLLEVDGLAFAALRTPAALVEEGAAMHHCVATYLRHVADGECHIVGLRRPDGTRVATLELGGLVRKGSFLAVRQLKGPCNAQPAPEIVAAVQRYVRRVAKALSSRSGWP
ncbi:MAG: PcfJ domain-containing protein [Phenylobacterium sp.]|nr:PcfJ domain-containing protein [Phenylobacterium sp.]